VKRFAEALQRLRSVRSALCLSSEIADVKGAPTMKTLIITTALALGVGFFSTASFAAGYVVNGHAASPIEAQLLVANGVQPGT
jgi:hypothetical protein